jgi:asparagine synthase (glutamine-hydrolysing)
METFARDVLAPETLRRHGLLDPAATAGLLDRHVRREEDLSREIWGLLTLTLWMESDGPPGPPAA